MKDGAAHLYGSRAYLDQLGNPTTREELSRAQFIGFDRDNTLLQALNATMGLSLTQSSFTVITENQLLQWELTKRGLGITIMTEEVGDAEPLVRRALPVLTPFPVPLWLTTHRELSTSRRMRVVFDLLVAGGGALVRSAPRRSLEPTAVAAIDGGRAVEVHAVAVDAHGPADRLGVRDEARGRAPDRSGYQSPPPVITSGPPAVIEAARGQGAAGYLDFGDAFTDAQGSRRLSLPRS